MTLHWSYASSPCAIAIDEAHAYAVAIDATTCHWGQLLATLSPDERHRAEQFRFDAPRRRFVAARGALRILLGKYLAMDPKVIELDVGLGGKPKLSSTHDVAFRFNVSHSGDLALIAITNGCEVGVDVEQVRDVNHMEQIAKRFFLPSEYGAIMELSPADQCHAFLRCWTGKEAVLKAIGEGIATNWSVAGLTDNDRATWIDVPARNSGGPLGCWQQPLALGSDYVGAIAFCNYKRVVRCFALTI